MTTLDNLKIFLFQLLKHKTNNISTLFCKEMFKNKKGKQVVMFLDRRDFYGQKVNVCDVILTITTQMYVNEAAAKPIIIVYHGTHFPR